MKKCLFLLAILIPVLILSSDLPGQDGYDLRMTIVENAQINGGEFDVLVQMKASTDSFKVGSSNLVFNYNTAALHFDSLLARHNFSGQFYANMRTTEPVTGRVSINIELFATNFGTMLPDSFINVVTLRFTIANNQESPLILWRTITPNATVVFLDDEATIVPSGALQGLDISLPIDDVEGGASINEFRLEQNYPNPFNPATIIEYQLPVASAVKIVIYNVAGQMITTLLDNYQSAGQHKLRFEAKDLPSGIYFYEMWTPDYAIRKKMTLLK